MQRLRSRFRHAVTLNRINRRRKLTKVIRKRQRERRAVYFRQEIED